MILILSVLALKTLYREFELPVYVIAQLDLK